MFIIDDSHDDSAGYEDGYYEQNKDDLCTCNCVRNTEFKVMTTIPYHVFICDLIRIHMSNRRGTLLRFSDVLIGYKTVILLMHDYYT